MDAIRKRTRGYLPHWEREDGTYFITFRLHDPLPVSVISNVAAHRELLQAARANRELLPAESVWLARLATRQMEAYLDTGAGDCLLKKPEAASIVASTLGHADKRDYILLSWCVMPNHVHVLCRLISGVDVAGVVRRWKSYTATQINKLLRRTGPLWQREYFDRLVRNEGELHRAVDYILANPIKAELRDWKWTYVSSEVQPKAG